MKNLIIYPNNDGGICIVTPVQDTGYTIEDVVKRVVPLGSAYFIIDSSDLPTDRLQRQAWTCNFETAPVNL